MKELRPVEAGPAIPAVEYKYEDDNSVQPFRVRLDAEKLGSLLKVDFELNDTQIQRSKFTVTDEVVMSGIAFNIGPEGHSVSESHTMGTTDFGRDKDGYRNITVNLGSILLRTGSIKSIALDYCVLSKQQDLPPSLAGHKKQAEAILPFGFRTKRMLPYLKQVDWHRANAFLDKMTARKLAHDVSNVLVHESSHLKDLDEAEQARSDFRNDRKRQRVAIGGGVAGLIGYLGTAIVDAPFVYAIIPLGFSLSALGTVAYSTLRLIKNVEYQKELVNSTEEKAKFTAENVDTINNWAEVIRLEPNPNYSLTQVNS